MKSLNDFKFQKISLISDFINVYIENKKTIFCKVQYKLFVKNALEYRQDKQIPFVEFFSRIEKQYPEFINIMKQYNIHKLIKDLQTEPVYVDLNSNETVKNSKNEQMQILSIIYNFDDNSEIYLYKLSNLVFTTFKNIWKDIIIDGKSMFDEMFIKSLSQLNLKIRSMECSLIESKKEMIFDLFKKFENDPEFLHFLKNLQVFAKGCNIKIFDEWFDKYGIKIKKVRFQDSIIENKNYEYHTFQFLNVISKSNENICTLRGIDISNLYMSDKTYIHFQNEIREMFSKRNQPKNEIFEFKMEIENKYRNSIFHDNIKILQDQMNSFFQNNNCNILYFYVEFMDNRVNTIYIEKYENIFYCGLFDPSGFVDKYLQRDQNEFIKFLSVTFFKNRIFNIIHMPDSLCPNIEYLHKSNNKSGNDNDSCYWFSYYLLYKMLSVKVSNPTERLMVMTKLKNYVSTNNFEEFKTDFNEFIDIMNSLNQLQEKLYYVS